ncbi:hypothetical protein J2X65_002987 [Ancylobacter sp. 3268]|uniref:Hint domain-containing protein n=1 Tax=Ancylobacter sp. 3268 TaxID=2817752 RepID=UPI002858BF70|nr:Hint domain-containing protein [Ancylobacter sp. 3268]MDR6953624.1 hypothetical protein [Ancylobacter sp. 3268]
MRIVDGVPRISASYSASPGVASNIRPGNEFVTGDELTPYGDIYIGYNDDGFVAQEIPEFYYLYSNDISLAIGDEVQWTAMPFIVCFLAGTMIAAPDGEVAIETLRVGDLVLTAGGDARPVRWLARQTVSTVFADPLRVLPIRIAARALGDNLPVRDLFVSADHALEIDGLLVQAGALVNGTTIVRHAEMPQTFVYYHVELDDHSLILAEGVPAETFVDNVSRRRFDNYAEFEGLYSTERQGTGEIDLPRVKSARQLPASIRAGIAAQAPAIVAAA